MQNINTVTEKDLTSIIIVNYNTGNYLKRCLESIYKFEDPKTFQIIIVDNASTDNSDEIIYFFTGKYNNIIFIKSHINNGFAKANNIGFKNSLGEYILILNPDTEFRTPLLSELKQNLVKSGTGAVSPLLKGINEDIQYIYYQKYPSIRQYLYFHSMMAKIFSGREKLKNKYICESGFDNDEYHLLKVQQLPCAFLLTRRDIFSEAGLMNEKYFLFFEDVDLCFNIAKKYDLYVDTSLSVLHYGGASFNIEKNPEIYGKYILSMNIFFDLNFSGMRAFSLKIITILNSLLILLAEYCRKLFGRSNKFRIEKHKNFLKLFKQYYF